MLNASLPILLASTLWLMTACNNDDDTDGDPNDPPTGNSASSFGDSPIAEERFANVIERDTDPAVEVETVEAVVAGFNAFSFELHRLLATEAPSENAVSSGYSIATAVSLLRATAAGDIDNALANLTGVAGIAEADLHRAQNRLALDLASRGNDDLLLRTANRLLTSPQRAFNETFLDTAAGQYGAPATEIDFFAHNAEALELVNAWVSAQTDGMIPELLTSLSRDTVAVIVNAILLDALWQQPFQSRGDRPFLSLDGTTHAVAAFGDIRSLSASQDDQLTAVEIPYAGGDLAMLLVMPSAITAYESTMTEERFDALRDDLAPAQVDLTLPAWQTSSRFDPRVLLETIGWPANPIPLDDLLDDSEPKGLYELDAIHEAIIEVDENGTRAAAATGIGIIDTSVPVVDLTIAFDRPFLYYLIDRPSGLVLFSGRVVDLS